jgi:2-polyprenyl-3-methyl-5-hydroxy-6-metoxy-1,4-benzoquinol methylase
MPDFSRRSEQTEIIDDLNAPEKELRQNLRELKVVNKYLGGYEVILKALNSLKLRSDGWSVMDLGSGGGDTLRAIAAWMRRKKLSGTLTGVDWNRVMTNYAVEHSAEFPAISYRTADIFDDALKVVPAQVVLCNLFCHHFPHERLVKLVRRMKKLASHSVVINDLHRHWFAYYSIRLLTGLFSKTYIVKHDAAVSVACAFTRKDWVQVMEDAGITNYTLQWKWAFRWLVIIPVHYE